MNTRATVIFDFDGTLANSVDLLFDLYNEHVDEFGYRPLTRNEFPSLRRMGYKKAMKTKGIRYRMVPKMVVTIGREMRHRMNEVQPYDGIIDMLHTLQQRGFSIGVLTSNQAPLVKEFFTEHGFPSFDFVISEKTLFGKDKALRRIIKRFGLQKDQVIYVGDEPRDVSASRKAGIQVIGVTWGLGGREGFEKIAPDAVVEKPLELLNTIIETADSTT